jgi:DNA-binding NarL/FixJ family response regulator
MPGPPTPPSAHWPLVGREVELEDIARARADPACAGVVVRAAAGMGKSRLVREAHAAAARDGAHVDWIQATRSAATVPLGALAAVIPEDVRTDDALQLMRRSGDVLRARADGGRVVLGLDDAQLLDPVSAALILHLTVTGAAFVVATVRSGEPCPDAIVSLWKDAGARRLELTRLGDDAVGRLVEAALGGPVEHGTLRWLVERSAGNALYLRELVVGATESGVLAHDGDLWRFTGPPPVTRSLVELVARRLDALPDAERTPVEALALAEPLSVQELIALGEVEALAAAESSGLVVVEPDGSAVRLAHPLYGDVVRSRLPLVRGRLLRGRVADVIRGRDPLSGADALRVARLLLDAGTEIPPELRVPAARAANLAGDPELGAELAASALADGGGLPAALLLSRAHTVSRRFADAEAVLAAVAPAVEPDDAGIDYLVQRAHVLHWGLHRAAEARDLIEAARAWSPAPGWQRRLEPLRAAFIEGDDALTALAAVVRDPGVDPATRTMAERRFALRLFFAGRTREARDHVAGVLPDVPLRGYNDALALGLWRLLAFETGEGWEALGPFMEGTLRAAVRANDHEAAGHAAFSLGYLAFMAGRHRAALRWLAEAEHHFARQDTFGTRIHVRAIRVGVAFHSGDLDGTAEAAARLDEALAGREPLSTQAPYVARARGWAARVRSDAEGAERLLADAARLTEQMPVYAAQLTYEALRAGAGAAKLTAALDALGARCDARLTDAYARHARALAARDGDALLAVAEELAAIGALRYASEAAADAARTFVGAARTDSARRALERARALHVAHEGTPPPSVDGVEGTAAGLTRREAQVATLAGQGATNLEIAERLGLSVRTVESHVYHAMQKTGAADRRDL